MTDWVEIGTETMKKARKAQGLSYESASRVLHVSSKTYERREKAGRWPRHDVSALAEALGLEIEGPVPESVKLTAADERSEVVRLLHGLDSKLDKSVTPRLDAIEQAIRELGRGQSRERSDQSLDV